CMQGLRFPFTF
nr:immunoglobulin light chain junction region [Macaca mulatta]